MTACFFVVVHLTDHILPVPANLVCHGYGV